MARYQCVGPAHGLGFVGKYGILFEKGVRLSVAVDFFNEKRL
jgi:hypothetical protein